MKAESKEEPYTKVEVPTITGRGKPMEVHIENLKEAPWNPRAEITAEDVAELAQSIRENGLLNRLSVVKDPESGESDGVYIVFAGNRRLAACREAGIKYVPVELFDITLTQAKVLTALENLQRKDVEPIREAGLVEDCLEAGMSGEEIAAKIGKSNAWVTRRRKLLSLPPETRKAADMYPGKITADALENIAIRPVAAKVLDKDIAITIRNQPGTVQWKDISYRFDKYEAKLEDSMWFRFPCGKMRERCIECAKRTGAQPDLFGDLKEGEGPGLCMDKKCFAKCTEQWKEDIIKWKIEPGTETVIVYSEWAFPKECTDEKSKKNPCAYVVLDTYGKKFIVKWGPSKKKLEEAEAKKRAKEEAEKRINEERRRAAKEACQKAEEVLCYPREVGELLRPLFSKKCGENAFQRICEWIAERVEDNYNAIDLLALLKDVEPLRGCLTDDEWKAYCDGYPNADISPVDWECRYEPDDDEDDDEADE